MSETKNLLRVGLTGGIGSGKSLVAQMLSELGASIVDTDQIAHDLTGPAGSGMPAIQAAFGAQMLDEQGALNRAAMRQKVFEDPAARQQLEAILHPLIRQEVQRQAQQAGGTYVVFVVPLLVESGRWSSRVDRVCVVDCERETQIERVMKRSGLTREQVEQILEVQATREARLAVAHDVVNNGEQTDFENLRQQVLVLHRQWCTLTPC